MELRIFVEPQQGASYEQQLAVAQAAERLGFGAFFRSDHYLRMGEGSPLPGPTDTWVTLGAIARETSTIRLGTLAATDAHTVLYAIEQNLMPADTGKKLEYEISKNAADPLAMAIQDYDWADEVLHVHIGRRWLLPQLDLPPKDAVARGWELRATTAGVLDAYADRGEQRNWWPDFVRAVLGRETAVDEFDMTRL